MIISGWGILLIFSANQAITQTLAPYPPFGLATLTVLVVAAFLMLLGIYNSAVLVSTNNTLRKSIRKHALESRLLDIIGHAEMEKEIQKTVTKIIESQDIGELHRETGIELDGSELRRYIDVAVREVKKDDKRPSS
jgi:high-affinity nickel permease